MSEQPSSSASISPARVATAAVACATQLLLFYPAWVTAKRLGAGLGWPKGSEFYRGSVAVWLCYFPTLACSDVVTQWLQPRIRDITSGQVGGSGEKLVASALAGAAAGLFVRAPTEGIVSRAHCLNLPVFDYVKQTAQSKNGLKRMLLPYGQTAMVGREVPFSVGIFFLQDYFTTLFSTKPISNQQAVKTVQTQQPSTGAGWLAREIAASMCTAVCVNIVSHPPSAVLALQQGHEMHLHSAIKHLYARGGLWGFYVGFWARTLTTSGSMFVIPTVMRFGAVTAASDTQAISKGMSSGRNVKETEALVDQSLVL